MERIISVSIDTGNKLKEMKKTFALKRIADVIDKLIVDYETNIQKEKEKANLEWLIRHTLVCLNVSLISMNKSIFLLIPK